MRVEVAATRGDWDEVRDWFDLRAKAKASNDVVAVGDDAGGYACEGRGGGGVGSASNGKASFRVPGGVPGRWNVCAESWKLTAFRKDLDHTVGFRKSREHFGKQFCWTLFIGGFLLSSLPNYEEWHNADIALPSFQSLYLRFWFGDQILASGTGFIVNTAICPLLMTARHNITGKDNTSGKCLHPLGGIPDRVEIFHNGPKPFTNISKTESLINEEGAPLWIEHPELHELCDVVALPLNNIADCLVLPYPINVALPDISIRPSELVSVIGFPMGHSAGEMAAIWCSGFVASEFKYNYAERPQFLIDCRTRQGQSGSPVIAYRSSTYSPAGGGIVMSNGPVMRPLGIYTGRIHAEADIGIVWKWSVVEIIATAAALKIANAIQDVMISYGQDSAEFESILRLYGLIEMPKEFYPPAH